MINPVGLTLRQYADALRLTVGSSWGFGKLERESEWRDWLVGFVRASPFVQSDLPDPYQFADWRAWGMRAYPILERGSD